MKAVTFSEKNVIIAKDQKEYNSLPAFAQGNGILTVKFKLNPIELTAVLIKGHLPLRFKTFNRPVQPCVVHFTKPEFPIPFNITNLATLGILADETDQASCNWVIAPEDKKQLIKTSSFWLTIVTYSAPLNPIRLSLK